MDILRLRIANQWLARPARRTPEEIVAWLGAVQSQDYAGAKWGVAQRSSQLTDAALDTAFAEGRLLRTHALRPTWHFVTPADIRWILLLTAPRVHQANTYVYRQCQLDRRLLSRSRSILERALDGQTRTRTELAVLLEAKGIHAATLRLAYLMMHAELEGVICSGPRRGVHFTYALLDQRAPRQATMTRNEALLEMTRRYFQSRGPATVRDFAWWSGLTMKEAKTGVDMIQPRLERIVDRGLTYWFVAPEGRVPPSAADVHLLPNYDEYLIAYKDRDLVLRNRRLERATARSDVFSNYVVRGTVLAGTWRRSVSKSDVHLEVQTYARRSGAFARALARAVKRFSAFVGRPLH